MSRKLLEEYSRWGLKVNLSKAQYLCIGQEGRLDDLWTQKMKKKYEECTGIYLGIKNTKTGRTDEALKINDRKLKSEYMILY